MQKVASFETTMHLVQVISGLGAQPALANGDDPEDPSLDVAQWEPVDGYFCEFQNDEAFGEPCDSGTVSWGTSDPLDPKFCTRHFFNGSTGYEFVGPTPNANGPATSV